VPLLLSALAVLASSAALLTNEVRASTSDRSPRRPNVVLIMTDNHGAWTLGCYGNKDIRTPNIDKLAEEGTLFDNAFASNPVCSPTRATTLTGLIPSQHGVHCFLRGGRLQTGPDARNTLDEFTSLPEVLKREGYRCGLVGKWHLGGNESPQEGMDDYWITMPHGGTSTFYDAKIIEDGKQRTEPEYLTDFWTKHAVKFVETDDDKPFFLFLAYNGPYSLSRLLLREGQNRHAEFYRGKELPSFPRETPHPWQLHNRDYQNNPVSIQRVATEVSGVDDGVGTVMAALKANGLDDNTIVIFMADQGWVGGHGGFFGMGDHTRPTTAVDGMMKIPLIVRQPGRIGAGKRSQKLVANYDIYNSLLDHLGVDANKADDEPVSPGKSFAAELQPRRVAAASSSSEGATAYSPGRKPGDSVDENPKAPAGRRKTASRNLDVAPSGLSVALNSVTPGLRPRLSAVATSWLNANAPARFDEIEHDDAIFYEFETLRTIRTADWKYTERFPNGPHELYDLKNDPQEFENLYRDEPAAIQQKLQDRLHTFFAKYASPKYDLCNAGGSQTVIYDGVEEEIAQADPVEPPALPEGFKAKEFTLPEGFSSQLIAGPPLVNHPTMGCFDDTGRLFICDGAGANMSAEELEKNLPNEIKMLEDQDGDGVFDKSTVFADKMTFPMGGTWHDGALYVASPPNIWRLEDTTGDGKADKRDILVDKFGYTGNAASIHGCFKHPSGRIYWCDGYHGHEFKDKDGNVTSSRKGSYIFSCWPDGSDVRIHCGGGMDNPVEVDFTDEGDIIGTVNIMYTRPRIDCLVHWQYGGAYPHREAVLDELKVTGDVLGPIHNFGHVAISGTTRYRSGVMTHQWGGNFFATEFNLGKVVRVELEPSGSTYTCTEREFLSCNNRDFHPTDVIEDADGSLVVVDTGGWFYRGCPTSQIARPDVKGGLYRIVRDGMTTQVDPRGNRIAWADRTAGKLMQDLKDTRYAVREKAIQECVRRGDSMVPMLASTLKNGDIVARQNAIWALSRLLSVTTSDTAQAAIVTALADRDARIRQAACYVLSVIPNPAAKDALAARLSDSHPAVRRQAAVAAGRIKGDDITSALWAQGVFQYPGDADREEQHARMYALIEQSDPMAIQKMIDSSDGPRLELLTVLAETSTPSESAVQQIVKALTQFQQSEQATSLLSRVLAEAKVNKNEALLQQAQRQVAQQLPVWLTLKPDPADPGATDRALRAIEFALRRYGDDAQIRSSVNARLSDADCPATLKQFLLSLTGDVPAVAKVPKLQETIVAALASHDFGGEQFQLALDAAKRVDRPEIKQTLAKIAASENTPALIKARAFNAAAGPGRGLPDAAFSVLSQIMENNGPDSAKAAKMLASSGLTAAQSEVVSQFLKDAGPQQLNDLLALFSGRLTTEQAINFLDNVENARSLSSVPALTISEIVKRFPEELHDRANSLLDKMQAAEQAKLLKLDSLIGQLKDGNATRGRDVFFSEKAKCATCHVVGKNDNGELLGKRVGPDLTTIGASRAPKDLLESILFPSSTIVRQYEPYTLVTTAGRSYSGLVIKDTAEEITIQQSTGDPVTVARNDVEELVPSTVSIMPKGLDETLTAQQIADMVAWLQTLR